MQCSFHNTPRLSCMAAGISTGMLAGMLTGMLVDMSAWEELSMAVECRKAARYLAAECRFH